MIGEERVGEQGKERKKSKRKEKERRREGLGEVMEEKGWDKGRGTWTEKHMKEKWRRRGVKELRMETKGSSRGEYDARLPEGIFAV